MVTRRHEVRGYFSSWSENRRRNWQAVGVVDEYGGYRNFRWLRDSQRALIVYQDDSTSWNEVSQVLTASERAKAISESESFWRRRNQWRQLLKKDVKDVKAGSASFLYLKYKYGATALKAVLSAQYKDWIKVLYEPIYRLRKDSCKALRSPVEISLAGFNLPVSLGSVCTQSGCVRRM